MDVTEAIRRVQTRRGSDLQWHELAEAADVLVAEVERLRAALRPFAEKGRESTGLVRNGCWAPLGIRVEDWRAAAAAMEGEV